MISIVICSRTKNISSSLCENIKSTIGCEYELIIIDNSESKYSIFEAYNIGIKKSVGEYLCFIHDDISLLTQDWGATLEQIFENDIKIGLIGVAGAKVKTKMPSAWWDCDEREKVINIVQHYPNKTKKLLNSGFTNMLEEVVVIDGVFMAWRKDNYFWFNEKLEGFHNYDLNIAIECLIMNYKIVVTNQILIEHLSLGTLNKSWYESTIKLHEFYNKTLPIHTNDLQKSYYIKIDEFKNGARFINQLIKFGWRKKTINIWLKLIIVKPISKYHFKFIKTICNK